MSSAEQFAHIAATLRIFAQPQRLAILASLQEGARPVGTIEAVTNVRQPALSQQLALLRREGVVAVERCGRQVLYRLADTYRTKQVSAIFTIFSQGTADSPSHGHPLGDLSKPSAPRAERAAPLTRHAYGSRHGAAFARILVDE